MSNRKPNTQSIAIKRQVIVWLLWILLLGLVLVYGFLLWLTVSSTAERGQVESRLPALAADVSRYELEYLHLRNQLDEERLAGSELEPVEEVNYARPRALGQQF